MKPFLYIACATLDEACAALDEFRDDARILAGGTDLLIGLRQPGGPCPAVLVDISRITPLRGIDDVAGSVCIGALTTHAAVTRSELLHRCAPLLVTASSCIGSPQIRNRGTIGGNIMHGATCADSVPPLIALGAGLRLVSRHGSRVVPIADFFRAPYTTVASPAEVLHSITVPPLPRGARTSFLKLGRRNALSIARLSIAALLVLDEGGKIREARIVPGAATPIWKRTSEAEALLLGRPPSSALFSDAGRAVSSAMIAETGRRWSTEYKEPVLAVLVRRALEACWRQSTVTSGERTPG